jgi:hypothetical protein
MIMSQWLTVDRKRINAPLDDSQVGVDFQLFVSPYDIPVAIKGGYDESIHRFVIELQYDSAPEQLAEPEVAEHVQFYSGRDSGRLHRIVVNVDEIGAASVQLQIIVNQIEHAINQLRTQRSRFPSRRNYVAAQRAISQLPALAGAN